MVLALLSDGLKRDTVVKEEAELLLRGFGCRVGRIHAVVKEGRGGGGGGPNRM